MNEIKIVKNFIPKNELQSMIDYVDFLEKTEINKFAIYQNGRRLALQFGKDLYHEHMSYPSLEMLSQKENQIREYFNQVVDKTKKIFDVNNDLYVCSFWLAKQYPGATIPAHEDTDGGINTHFTHSAILYLNELSYGGELLFLETGYSYKPEAGDLVIFPTSGTGFHTVLEIPETRYSLPFWITADPSFML
jgi:hypothetical protein